MSNDALRQEWLENIKNINPRDVFNNFGRFSVKTDFYNAPEEIKLDKEITFKVLIESNEFLWNAHSNFRNDKNFIQSLIEHNYAQDIYRALSFDLKKDIEIFKQCFFIRKEKINKYDFKPIPLELLNNKPLMLEFIPYYDNIFELFKSNKLYQTDKDIVEKIIESHPKVFSQLSLPMKKYICKNQKFLNQILKNNDYKHLAEKDKNRYDLSVINLALSVNPENYVFIPDELKTNEKTLQFLQQHHISLKNIPEHLKNDYDIVKKSIQNNAHNFLYLNNTFKNNKELLFIALEQKNYIGNLNIGYELLDDKELANILIDKDIENYKWLSQRLKNDYDIAKKAMNISTIIYNHLGADMLDRWEFFYQKITSENKIPSIISKNISEEIASHQIAVRDLEKIKILAHNMFLTEKVNNTLRENKSKNKVKI